MHCYKILPLLYVCKVIIVKPSKTFSDYKTGFGGQFGVQKDRVDKSAVGWDHVEKVEKHDSQKGNVLYEFSIFVIMFSAF